MTRTTVKGLALIQVLIIAMVLAIFGLFLIQSVKSQVNIALDIQSAFNNKLKVENEKARLIFALLTEQKVKSNSDSEIARKWNFYGQEFVLDSGVTVTLQDLRSLVSLNIIDRNIARAVFGKLGAAPKQQDVILDSLADWKDSDDLARLNGAESADYKNTGGPRNGYLQSVSEVRYVQGADVIPENAWEQYFSIEFVSDFNPLNAPKLVLSALLNDNSVVNEVIKMRENGQLTPLNFYHLTGIDEDEFISFSPGKSFKVTLTSGDNNSVVRHQFIVKVDASSLTQPITFTDVTWNKK